MTNIEKLCTMLERAEQEIHSLRQRNAVLQARCDVLDTFATIARYLHRDTSQSYGLDLAWEIQQLLAEVAKKEPQKEQP